MKKPYKATTNAAKRVFGGTALVFGTSTGNVPLKNTGIEADVETNEPTLIAMNIFLYLLVLSSIPEKMVEPTIPDIMKQAPNNDPSAAEKPNGSVRYGRTPPRAL